MKKMKQLFQATNNKIAKNASLIESEMVNEYNKEYLPGGTLHITINKWKSYITEKITDVSNMARWSGATYRLSPVKKLHMISAYRPCKASIDEKNSLATYTQQYYKLLEDGIQNPDPREQFIEDLLKQIKLRNRTTDDYLIIGLDANEAINNENNGINRLIKEGQLINMYQAIHGETPDFPTHINGSKCIDFILCTYNVLPFITKCGYVRFHEALDSDHRAIFCDISNNIFKTHIPDKVEQIRMVGSNSRVK
jgi:hypothetical protein